MPKFKKQKISKGCYLYRGYKLNRVDYYAPEQRACWEIDDKDGRRFDRAFNLEHALDSIDMELDGEEIDENEIYEINENEMFL